MKSFSRRSNFKKGNIIYYSIFLVIFLIVFITTIINVNVFVSEINQEIQADSDINTQSKDLMNTYNTNYAATWDGMFIFAFVLIWIVLLISAYFIDIQPIFFVITIILMVGVLFIAAWIGNVYEEMVGDDDLITYAVTFQSANFIMSNLLTTIIVVIFSVIIILYGKNKFG